MDIGQRLRELRAAKDLSQADIEKRTGLLRCYVSRVENGHTVPSLETLERLASALEIPLHQMFYEGEEPPPSPNLSKRRPAVEPKELLSEEHGTRRRPRRSSGRRPRVRAGSEKNDWQRLLLRNLVTEGYSRDEARALVEMARS